MQGTPPHPRPVWYRDPGLCTGMFDGRTRAGDILRYRALPEELVAIRVTVPKTDAGSLHCGQGSSDAGKILHRHFICFGFSSENKFMMPGTPIHFYEEGSADASNGPARKAEVSSMYTANGRRDGEKAILISFTSPQSEADVSALFNDSFTLTEIESREELFSAIQDLVKNFTDVSGDTEECIRGCQGMMEHGLRRWNDAMSKAEDAMECACRREDDRGMAEYFKALACVDGLRKRGVALNEDIGRDEEQRSKKTSKRPRMGLAYAAHNGGQQNQQDHQQKRLSIISTGRAPCNDDLVVEKNAGKVLNIANFNSSALFNHAACLTKRRKEEISHAHARYVVGLLGCMRDNPVALRQYFMMYEDFMRAESGAEISFM